MKTRIKKVPATTNNITTAIINFLNSKGHFAFRVNTTGIYDPINQIFRKPDANSKGCPDVLACINSSKIEASAFGFYESGVGLFLGIEVKNELTKDSLSKNQKDFHCKLFNANGEVWVIHSYSEFLCKYSDRFE